jgi:uncharacterized protein (TIGR02722 family)
MASKFDLLISPSFVQSTGLINKEGEIMFQKIKFYQGALMALAALMLFSSCGPRAFVRGTYDDVERENLLNDQWSETDMQIAVKEIVASLSNSAVINRAKTPPVVMVTALQNNTSEHLNTQAIMDMMRVEVSKTGKLLFVDREARQSVKDEYEYQGSGMVREDTRSGPGQQVGADFILNGRIESIVQEVGRDKTVFYKLTFNLTDIRTNLIHWTDHKQIRKVFRKQRVRM